MVCPSQTSRWGPNGRRGVASLISSTVCPKIILSQDKSNKSQLGHRRGLWVPSFKSRHSPELFVSLLGKSICSLFFTYFTDTYVISDVLYLISGHMDTWMCGYLHIWTSEYLDVWIRVRTNSVASSWQS